MKLRNKEKCTYMKEKTEDVVLQLLVQAVTDNFICQSDSMRFT